MFIVMPEALLALLYDYSASNHRFACVWTAVEACTIDCGGIWQSNMPKQYILESTPDGLDLHM